MCGFFLLLKLYFEKETPDGRNFLPGVNFLISSFGQHLIMDVASSVKEACSMVL